MLDLENAEEQDFRESFGDFIRRHREASGKTIDGISRTTRIPKRYLEAFESNDRTKLPEEAFARGFLRSFAQEIGLDVEDCMIRYDRFVRSLMPTQIKEVKKAARVVVLGEGNESKQVQDWVKWALLGGAGLTVIVLLLLWVLRPSSPDSKEVAIEVPTTAAEPKVETPVAETSTAPATAAKPSPSSQTLTVPVTPSILSIKALRDSQLTVRLDENATQDLSMKQGDSQTLNVFREVEIRTTDKTAFQFQYNGKPLEVAGPVLKLFNRNLFDKKR